MAGLCGLFAAVGRCPGEWDLRGGWGKPCPGVSIECGIRIVTFPAVFRTH